MALEMHCIKVRVERAVEQQNGNRFDFVAWLRVVRSAVCLSPEWFADLRRTLCVYVIETGDFDSLNFSYFGCGCGKYLSGIQRLR